MTFDLHLPLRPSHLSGALTFLSSIDVRDSRCVLLFNMKKPEMAESLAFLPAFFNGFFDTNNSRSIQVS